MSIGDLSKIFASSRAQYRRTRYPSDEAEQIVQCIKDMSNLSKANISDYHEI